MLYFVLTASTILVRPLLSPIDTLALLQKEAMEEVARYMPLNPNKVRFLQPDHAAAGIVGATALRRTIQEARDGSLLLSLDNAQLTEHLMEELSNSSDWNNEVTTPSQRNDITGKNPKLRRLRTALAPSSLTRDKALGDACLRRLAGLEPRDFSPGHSITG